MGVRSGTTHQKFITDKHPEITTVPYDSYQNAKLDLQNGRIDAVFGDTAVVTEWLKSNPKLAAVGDKVTEQSLFRHRAGHCRTSGQHRPAAEI